MPIVLGLDYGEAHVGMALTDEEGRTALAHGSLKSHDTERLLEDLADFVQREQVSRIVVGLPFTLSGEEGFQAQRVRAFTEQLNRRVAVPIECIDERFSTSGGKAVRVAKGQGDIHAEAARLILDTWLQRNAHRPADAVSTEEV